jgi:hypothetical protein
MVWKRPLVIAHLKQTADPVVFGNQSGGSSGQEAVPTLSLASLRTRCIFGPSDAISDPMNLHDERTFSSASGGFTNDIRMFRRDEST